MSTKEQTTEQQETALKAAGCERVYRETASGAREDRPELARLLDTARPGDVLVIVRLDRLARSIRHLIRLADTLKERGIHLHSLSDAIDTSTASGELHFHMLAALAQFERGLIRERSRAGLERAWASGKVSGRKPATHPDKIGKLAKAKALIENGMSPAKAAREAGLAVSTVYKYLDKEKTESTINVMNKRKKMTNGTGNHADVRQLPI